jgi:hypothetical protein
VENLLSTAFLLLVQNKRAVMKNITAFFIHELRDEEYVSSDV